MNDVGDNLGVTKCLPEETDRRIVDIISDVNMCYRELARRYLVENVLPKERTYVISSPMVEVLHANFNDIYSSYIHRRLGLDKGKYILMSAHREKSSYFISTRHPFPAVCIRTSTERPETLDKGNFILADFDEKSLLQAAGTAVQTNLNGDYGIPVSNYRDQKVSCKVVKIIHSDTGVVNNMV